MRDREIAVLVVGDEERTRSRMRETLAGSGFRVCTAAGCDEALRLVGQGAPFGAVVVEGAAATATVRALHESGARLPVVVVGKGGAEEARAALDAGAADFVAQPLEDGELASVLLRHAGPAVRPVEPAANLVADVPEFVSASPAMKRVFEMVARVADADVPVLIRGESGVGKEIVARSLHAGSGRSSGPFVKINCAALPSELLESELFGHEKGAFTGAHAEKPGKFELAHGGTIFLDELGEMAPALQAKLLQVLQDEEFYRVGGKRSVRVDARVVVATHRDLEAEIERGQFREDLYYRLNVVSVRVPPLRDRREDIAPLVALFAERYGRKYRGQTPEIRSEVLRRFQEHDWPGNVRELENMVRRLVVLDDDRLVLDELPVRGSRVNEVVPAAPAAPDGLKEIGRRAAMLAERDAMEQMLKLTGWNKRKAAQRLKISYKALLYKIKESGIRDPRLAHAESA